MKTLLPDDATALYVLDAARRAAKYGHAEELEAIMGAPATIRAATGMEPGFLKLCGQWVGPLMRDPAISAVAMSRIVDPSNPAVRIQVQGDQGWLSEARVTMDLRGIKAERTPRDVLFEAWDMWRDGDSAGAKSVLVGPIAEALCEPVIVELTQDNSRYAGSYSRFCIWPNNTVTLVGRDASTRSAFMTTGMMLGSSVDDWVGYARDKASMEGFPVFDVPDYSKISTPLMDLRPYPMDIGFPSDDPSTWLKFQGEILVGHALDVQLADAIQHFMKLHGTEALTDGEAFYTLTGTHLSYCNPDVCKAPATSQPYLLATDWPHCFFGSEVTNLRWLMSATTGKVLAAQSWPSADSDDGAFHPLSRDRLAHLQESLDQNNVLTNAKDHGVEPCSLAPYWVPADSLALGREKSQSAGMLDR